MSIAIFIIASKVSWSLEEVSLYMYICLTDAQQNECNLLLLLYF